MGQLSDQRHFEPRARPLPPRCRTHTSPPDATVTGPIFFEELEAGTMDAKLLDDGHKQGGTSANFRPPISPQMATAVPVQGGYSQQPQTAQPIMAPQMAMPAPGGAPMSAPGYSYMQGGGGLQQGTPAAAVYVGGAAMAPQTAGFGLEVLGNVAGLCIRQKIRIAELLVGWEQKNRFKIMVKPPTMNPNEPLSDEVSQSIPPIFWAIEESDCCARQVCHNHRAFKMTVLNAMNEQILVLERPFTCTCVAQGCCICPSPNEMSVRLPSGMALGRIIQGNVVCNCDHWFSISDATGLNIYTIKIPFCECWATPRPNCFCELWTAEVHEGTECDKAPVATLQNIFPGCNVRGLCTKADNFQVNYLAPLPVEHKALIFCSMFLIDMVYFEVRENNQGASGY